MASVIDYEADVKAIFAQHLADDLHGIGRVEAAAYKTAKHIYLKGTEDGLKAVGLDDVEVKRLIKMVG